METLIPEEAVWVNRAVKLLDPEQNQVTLDNQSTITYEYLIVAAGIEIDWDSVKGLKAVIGKKMYVVTNSFEHVQYTWETIRNFTPGTALFTHPNSPVKCGGVPQKIMYLVESYFRKQGIRDRLTLYSD